MEEGFLFRRGVASRKYPKGDGHDARRFSPRHGCCVEKSCWRNEPFAQRAEGAKAEGAFFWLLFFAQTKKSNSLSSKAGAKDFDYLCQCQAITFAAIMPIKKTTPPAHALKRLELIILFSS